MSLDDLIVRAGGGRGDNVRRHGVTGEMSGREGGEKMGYGRHQAGGWGRDSGGERSRQNELTREGRFSYQIYGRRDKRRDPSRSEIKVETKRRPRGVWEAEGRRRAVGEGWIDLEAFSSEQRVSLAAFRVHSNARLEVRTKRQTDRRMHGTQAYSFCRRRTRRGLCWRGEGSCCGREDDGGERSKVGELIRTSKRRN